jgi:hypothetical protein
MLDLDALQDFIIRAKAKTYVGGGKPVVSCRQGSHDLIYEENNFRYLDSYFGGANFIGEEVVYEQWIPVWGMNYYGQLLQPQKITAAQAGAMIKVSLSQMYASGRFLGGWECHQGDLTYYDTSDGDLTSFRGYEWIERDKTKVYELVYHGGLIIDQAPPSL